MVPEPDYWWPAGGACWSTSAPTRKTRGVASSSPALAATARPSCSTGSGSIGIVCPLPLDHDLDGGLKVPARASSPCLELPRYPLQEWQGLLFEARATSPPACAA